MPDLQNLAAIVSSPQAGLMANQAVQASDLATRQGVASLQSDMARQQSQVLEASGAADAAMLSSEGLLQAEAARPRARGKGGPSAVSASETPKNRIDLIA